MRTVLAFLAVGFAVPAVVADSPRRTATVDVNVVGVMSGPGFAFPAVGQLRKGDIA